MKPIALTLGLALTAASICGQETKPALPILIRGATNAAPQDPKPAAPEGSYAALLQQYQAAQQVWTLLTA